MCCLLWPRSRKSSFCGRLPPNCKYSSEGLHDKGGFPGVIGSVDGTYVRIQAPSTNENDFVNRKGFHSINVEAVCNHNSREHKAKINELFMLTMWLPSRKIFIQGKGLVMEAIFWEVTTFLLFCFCFFFLSSGDSPTCLLLLEQYDLLSPPHSRVCFFPYLLFLLVGDVICQLWLNYINIFPHTFCYERYSLIEKFGFLFLSASVSTSITSFSAIFLSCTFFLRAKCKRCSPNIRKTGLSGLNGQ